MVDISNQPPKRYYIVLQVGWLIYPTTTKLCCTHYIISEYLFTLAPFFEADRVKILTEKNTPSTTESEWFWPHCERLLDMSSCAMLPLHLDPGKYILLTGTGTIWAKEKASRIVVWFCIHIIGDNEKPLAFTMCVCWHWGSHAQA